MPIDLSAGLIVRDKKLFMVFDEEKEKWDVPKAAGESGELSSDTAERAVKQHLDCGMNVTKYRGKLKTEVSHNEKLINWQPYSVEIDEEAEPENGKWISFDDITEDEVAEPLPELAEQMSKKF